MGENQTVTNLAYTVKSNHNLLTGEDQTVRNLLTGEDQTVHHLLSSENQTVSTNNLLYTIIFSQRVVVHNLLTLIVYQRFDQYGSRSILKKLIFNQGF